MKCISHSLIHHEKREKEKKSLQLRYQNPAWRDSWPLVETVDQDIKPTLLINVPVLAIGTNLSFTLTSVTSEADQHVAVPFSLRPALFCF